MVIGKYYCKRNIVVVGLIGNDHRAGEETILINFNFGVEVSTGRQGFVLEPKL